MPNQHTKRAAARQAQFPKSLHEKASRSASAVAGNSAAVAPAMPPKATPDVALQLGRMNGSLVILQNVVDELEQRLEPAMGPEPTNGEGSSAEIAPDTAIGREIGQQRYMVDVTVMRLRGLLDRLGI